VAAPLVPLVPVQPPLAVQEVAFALVQVRVELPPDAIVARLADRVTDGATFTVVDAWPEPPAPVHDSVYVAVDDGDTLTVPLVALVPVQPPLALQEVVFVLDQVRVELPPDAILVGPADSVTVGGANTVTVADSCAEPSLPVHDSV
jgi:hypothetical protein